MARQGKKTGIRTTIEGGVVHGIVGAQNVIIENMSLYASTLPAEPPKNVQEGAALPCPYPGLANFGPHDSSLFFGRNAAIAQLTASVTRHSLIALVGASGSGKSSVVLAGLAPQLHAKGGWRFSHFRIGTEVDNNPFMALARALVPLFSEHGAAVQLEEIQTLARGLENDKIILSNVLSACRSSNPNRRILLIADQFEELFTLVNGESTRLRFIETLLAGFPTRSDGVRPDVCLALTLRADFYGMALRHRPLADALQGRIENLGPMTREELREAILKPAGIVKFESGLVDRLLDDVADEPSSLPLLQFALREMWIRMDNHCMTHGNYNSIDGVEGALAKRAQAIYETLTSMGNDEHAALLFRRLFTRLVTLGEGAQESRRTVARRELGDEAWQLAQRLADEHNRLLVTNAQEPRSETAEIAHEALLRRWPTLAGWINQDRSFQSWLQQITPNIDLWSRNSTDDGPLLRGGMLVQADEWYAHRRADMNPRELSFVEASISLRDRETRQKQLARQAELRYQEQLTRSAKWTRVTAILAGILLIAGAGVASFGLQQADFATERLRSNLLNRIGFITAAAEAKARDGSPELAALLVRETLPSAAKAQTDQFREAISVASSAIRKDWQRRVSRLGSVNAIAVSPDGHDIATTPSASRPLTIQLRHTQSGESVTLRGHTGVVRAIAFDRDGSRLASSSNDTTARVWDNHSGQMLRVLEGHTGAVNDVVFGADGHTLLTASDDNTARLWNLDTGAVISVFEGHGDSVTSGALSSDGSRVATVSEDGSARLWDSKSGKPVSVLSNSDALVRGVAFSPNSRFVVTWGGTVARLWEAESGNLLRTLVGHVSDVNMVSFSPESERIVTASLDNTCRVWNANTGATIQTVECGQDVRIGRFSRSGDYVLTMGQRTGVRLWDTRTGNFLFRFVEPAGKLEYAAFTSDRNDFLTLSNEGDLRYFEAPQSTVETVRLAPDTLHLTDAVFSPNRQRVLTLSGGATAELWDTRTGGRIAALEGHNGTIVTAEFSSDGERIITGSRDKTAKLWESSTGRLIESFEVNTGPVMCANLSPDGQHILTVAGSSTEGTTTQLWDLKNTSQPRTLIQKKQRYELAVFSPSGKFAIAYGRFAKTVDVWETPSATHVTTLPLQYGATAVAFGHDETEVTLVSKYGEFQRFKLSTGASTFSDDQFKPNRLAIFDNSTKRYALISDSDVNFDVDILSPEERQATSLIGHSQKISSLAFSLNGLRVLTVSLDKTARIWDASIGASLDTLNLGGRPILSAAFSSNDTDVIAVLDNGTIVIWRASPLTGEDLRDYIDVWASRRLSDTERSRYFPDSLESEKVRGFVRVISRYGNPTLTDKCDKQAAHPDDPKRKMPGIWYNDIDSKRAIESCSASLQHHPSEPRFAYQLGRALESSGERTKAREQYEAAAKLGYGPAHYNLASCCLEDGDPTKLEHLRNAWDSGFLPAGEAIADLYVSKSDFGEAKAWWQKASEKGYARAHQSLSDLFERGTKVDKDLERALFHSIVGTKLFEDYEGDADRARDIRYQRSSLARVLPPRTVLAVAKDAERWWLSHDYGAEAPKKAEVGRLAYRPDNR